MEWSKTDKWIPGGRWYEWECPHGIGHPYQGFSDQIHGCDGCCARADFPKEKPNWGKRK